MTIIMLRNFQFLHFLVIFLGPKFTLWNDSATAYRTQVLKEILDSKNSLCLDWSFHSLQLNPWENPPYFHYLQRYLAENFTFSIILN